MDDTSKGFLGTGWGFPIKFFDHDSELYTVSAEECVRQNIKMLLSTRKGERFMFPEYGNQLHLMVFQGIDQTLIYRIKEHLHHIFIAHEPRVTLENIEVTITDEQENTILLDFTYLIRETNTRTNLVFPYYYIEN